MNKYNYKRRIKVLIKKYHEDIFAGYFLGTMIAIAIFEGLGVI